MKLCPICATSYPAEHRTCPTHGIVLVDTPELPPGTMIRDCYRIERTLGKGGMGIVYLAEHTLMGEPRALKFLSNALASNPTFVQRFLQEARAASKLRHPNIAATLELGQSEDGSFYISMEYVEGPSLRAVIEQHPRGLPLERAVSIVSGVAGALAAAHAKRLVHRDIKPENVLLATIPESEMAKVVDFGIVAISDGADRLTQTGRPLLTAEYAAPEQWRGSMLASELDGRTDLYSLGCMFFEMLTGQLPFHAETYEGWFEKHVYATAPSPSYLRPELNNIRGLDKVVLHLLAKERDERTANVHEFLAELDRVLPHTLSHGSGLASQAGHDQPPRRQTMVATSEAYREPFPGQSPAPVSSIVPPYPPAAYGAVNVSKLDTFGSPINQPPAYNGGRPASQAPPPISARPVARPMPAKPGGMARYRGILFGALAAFLLIILGAVAFVIWQRRQEAARQSLAAHQEPAAQSLPQRSVATPAQAIPSQPNSTPADITQINTPRPNAGHLTTTQPRTSKSDLNSKPEIQAPPKALVAAAATPAELGRQGLAFYRQQQYAQAEPLLAKSCTAGQADSCDSLGRMYQRKQGVEQDYKKAWSLYSEACDDGSFQGCDHLASMYNYKLGIEQDYPRAATLYGKACNGGVLEACNDLGYMYQKKQGVQQDYAHALTLYQKACEGGIAVACNNLGIMYQDKEGVDQDFSRASTYYTKACDGGVANGCSDLGYLYLKGNGVPQDAGKARTYLSKGCSMGNQWGCDRLKQLN